MSWLGKLKKGLHKSAQRLSEGLSRSFGGGSAALSDEQIEELFETLIAGDVGTEAATMLCQNLKKRKAATAEILKEEIVSLLSSSVQPLEFKKTGHPQVILMVGVNGSGKTTSIAKLTRLYQEKGLNVMWAACDTFRAAAVDQLAVWSQRLSVPMLTEYPGHGSRIDPASLAYYALQQAMAQQADILFVDTAGRLHNNEALMQELARIAKSLTKLDPQAPQHVFLVLDATTGQSLIPQVQLFQKVVPVTGLILTKLDGTAKAGALIPITQKTHLPIVAIGVGEGLDDMDAWDPNSWAEALLGNEATSAQSPA